MDSGDIFPRADATSTMGNMATAMVHGVMDLL